MKAMKAQFKQTSYKQAEGRCILNVLNGST